MEKALQPMVGDTWFRAKDAYYSSWDSFSDTAHTLGPYLEEETFKVVKVTPKGVWIAQRWGDSGLQGEKRFVLLSAKRRFAHPSKEEALKSLVARKERQLHILMSQAERARRALSMAKAALDTGRPQKTEYLEALPA